MILASSTYVIKMIVTIIGFRSHKLSKYEVKDGKLTLIAGRSGAGKSTIFQAVYWCLYANMRHVYPNGTKGKCEVTLEFEDVIVNRKKNPEQVSIQIGNDIFDGEQAQKMIEQRFGTKDLWSTTSYIQQNSRCGLLFGTNSEKLAIINELSFTNCDPAEVQQKINNTLKEVQNNLLISQDLLNKDVQMFNSEHNVRPCNVEHILSSDTCLELTNEFQSLNTEILTLNRKIHEVNLARSKLQMLTTELNRIRNEYEGINVEDTSHCQDQINSMEISIKNHNEYRSYISTINAIKSSLPNLDKYGSTVSTSMNAKDIPCYTTDVSDTCYILDETGNVTDNDIIEARRLKDSYEKYKHVKSILETDSIENEIKMFRDRIEELDVQVKFLKDSEAKQLKLKELQLLEDRLLIEEKKMASLFEYDPDVQDKINEVNMKLKSTTKLVCPHCENGVQYTGSYLVKCQKISDEEILDLKNKLIKYNSVLQSNTEHAKLEYSIVDLKKRILLQREVLEQSSNTNRDVFTQNAGTNSNDSVSASCTDTKSLALHANDLLNEKFKGMSINVLEGFKNGFMSKIMYLQSLGNVPKVEEPKCSVEYLQDLQLYQRLNERLKSIPVVPEPVGNEPSAMEIQKIREFVTQMKILEMKRDTIMTRIIEIENSVLQVSATITDEHDLRLNEVTRRCNEIKTSIDNHNYSSRLMSLYNQIQEKNKNVQTLHTHAQTVSALRANAIKVECDLLEETVQSINLHMESILQIIFEDPITVQLSLYKETKSTKQMKPQVNLSIAYKGGEYDSISQLSGGEGDRISLALILSLSLLSPSPILLLDESLAALDGVYRELCIKAIRFTVGSSKTVIAINHEDVEGLYDETIHLV